MGEGVLGSQGAWGRGILKAVMSGERLDELPGGSQWERKGDRCLLAKAVWETFGCLPYRA